MPPCIMHGAAHPTVQLNSANSHELAAHPVTRRARRLAAAPTPWNPSAVRARLDVCAHVTATHITSPKEVAQRQQQEPKEEYDASAIQVCTLPFFIHFVMPYMPCILRA